MPLPCSLIACKKKYAISIRFKEDDKLSGALWAVLNCMGAWVGGWVGE